MRSIVPQMSTEPRQNTDGRIQHHDCLAAAGHEILPAGAESHSARWRRLGLYRREQAIIRARQIQHIVLSLGAALVSQGMGGRPRQKRTRSTVVVQAHAKSDWLNRLPHNGTIACTLTGWGNCRVQARAGSMRSRLWLKPTGYESRSHLKVAAFGSWHHAQPALAGLMSFSPVIYRRALAVPLVTSC